MKKLCPNLDREDALDTVLEVPVPEEMITTRTNSWLYTKMAWMKSNHLHHHKPTRNTDLRSGVNDLQLLLGVIGSPLIPLPLHDNNATNRPIRDDPLDSGMAKYIVEQYIAAAGGHLALESTRSMYAIGKVRMLTTEVETGGSKVERTAKNPAAKGRGVGEVGGFVLWQQRPSMWCIELVVSGCKIAAGSDGRVAWRQTPWQPSHASKGLPRPLRRSLQGLDPVAIASLFSNSVCVGEKTVEGKECFILKLDADWSSLRTQSAKNLEIMQHTMWGCFSQKTGLLVQLEDSHLLRSKATGEESIYWETTMESLIQDYRKVEGILVAHSGRTRVSLFRFGETSINHTRTKMEERWSIEEVDFNVQGLSLDFFLPPSDLNNDQDGLDMVFQEPFRASPRDVFGVSSEEMDSTEEDEEE